MRDYSIRWGDGTESSLPSEVRSFKNNRAAQDYARQLVEENGTVEVWREDKLIARLLPGDPPDAAEKAATATRARAEFLLADRDRSSREAEIQGPAARGRAPPADVADGPPPPGGPNVSSYPSYQSDVRPVLRSSVPTK